MKILFTGGGTGGHIYPIVGVIRELRRKYGGAVALSYLGPKDNFCKVVLSKEGVKVRTIMSGKIRRYLDPLTMAQNAIDATVKVPLGILQSFFWLFILNPDLVFSKGGFGSFPVVISAWILGIPVFLQESDVVPGLVSQKTAGYAIAIFTAFPKTEFLPTKKIILVGNPIRLELLSGSKVEAASAFGLKGGRPVILITGGSQGAQRINDKVLDAMPELLKNYEVVHLTGPRNIDQVTKESKITAVGDLLCYYHPVGFADERTLANAYAVADLIIGRAGSGSVFEIAAAKKPSILIPLPESAQNHQLKNAYIYAETGAALVMEESNFTNHLFLERVHDLLSSPETLAAMSEAAAQFARPQAGQVIADRIVKYLNK
ncbi:MAG: UDP-N-acetylglucosamine--N-acetylmuramyl-(pentapeptide) pyrophosphoryl-undecaprenol N-acetylglucosamine transferase [Candidatus Pacebacteria bacterium]|jgi:UDP-N-acetylglucosamine--N-acetylmuramyl-(pentapeptide) pyrophosphoryl-undecaprenol N-acetylglucosamine transferase|nr:UDP-N-acetylglucosamine--N-acetylmuramyl-(pentapeptide) pyrophosphoryl-undecaprenol N-acetylglucosamine transferase [Candidatus Paceibacterota bacterium]